MTASEAVHFSNEMEKRFEEFTVWAIAHWPNHQAPLSSADFDAVRREIALLARRNIDLDERNAAIPEPADSGPQYINVTPSPWP